MKEQSNADASRVDAPATGLLGRNVVYIREADPDALPENLREVSTTPWAIHDPDGNRLGIAPDRRLAFALARRNDLEPVSVH